MPAKTTISKWTGMITIMAGFVAVAAQDSDQPAGGLNQTVDTILTRLEQRTINDASAYAESIIPEARGEAQQQIEQANAYRDQVIARASGEADRFEKLLTEYHLAEEVTRNRLYIDAIESLLSNSSKIMVDVQGGNNLMYLPLDRLRQSNSNLSPAAQESARDIADAIMNEVNNRVASGRLRESR